MFNWGFGFKTLSVGFRNGFGFDIEIPTAKAIWVRVEDGAVLTDFNGYVILLPFMYVMFGVYFMSMEDG